MKQWKPNVTVAAVIQQEDSFLLVEEVADDSVVINQPAGHLENGENITDAIVREVREETTREFLPRNLVGIYMYPHPREHDVTYLRFCIHGDCGPPNPKLDLDKPILRTVWLTRAELQQRLDRIRSPLVTKCIDDHLSGVKYPLKILDQSLIDSQDRN